MNNFYLCLLYDHIKYMESTQIETEPDFQYH